VYIIYIMRARRVGSRPPPGKVIKPDRGVADETGGFLRTGQGKTNLDLEITQ
jgi:hypothetical protein